MIKKISLRNFKGHKNLDIAPRKITILIGPNGAGKSSVLQALMALRQSINLDVLRLTGPLINLGEFKDLINRGHGKSSLGIGIDFAIKNYPDLNLTGDPVYSCTTHWDPNMSEFYIEIKDADGPRITAKYSRLTGKIRLWPQNLSPSVVLPEDIEQKMGGQRFVDPKVHIRLRASASFRPLEIAKYIVPADISKNEQKSFSDFKKQVEELLVEYMDSLNNVYYVPAIRGIEQPNYVLLDEFIGDIPPLNNQQLATTFAYAGNDVKEMIEIWSEEITGGGISVNVIPGKRVLVRSSVAGGVPVISDGSGTNQLVHLLLMLAIIPSNSTLAIEEPEIHLHPKGQKKLCDILIQISQSWERQLIFSTHSEHMLYGVLSAVKDGRLKPNEVAIYYFEKSGVPPMLTEIDEGGDIYEWGRNFFSV